MRKSLLALFILIINYCLAGGLPQVIPYLYLNGKFGFVDTKGKQIVAPKYDNVYISGPGMYAVYLDKKIGVVDSNGKEVIPPKYVGVNGLRNYGYTMRNEESKWALFDPDGKVITEFIYENINFGENGLLPFTRGGKQGYLNPDGKEVIPPSYKYAFSFEYGIASVVDFPSSPEKYSGDTHIIDRKGNVLLTADHDIKIISKDKILHKKRVGGSYTNHRIYITNLKGDVLKELTCEGDLNMSMSSWHEGLSVFECAGKFGYVDTNLRIVIPAKYTKANMFYNGRASVKDGDKWLFIDPKGVQIFEYKYSTSSWLGLPSFSGKYLEVYDDATRQAGILGIEGKVVVPCTYDAANIGDSKAGLFVVKKDGKCGIINSALKTIIPFTYDKIDYYGVSQYIFKVERDGKSFFMDQTGKEYREK